MGRSFFFCLWFVNGASSGDTTLPGVFLRRLGCQHGWGSVDVMLLEYTQKALEKAEYKKLDDGTWFAEIPGFEGVWANGNTVEECRTELLEVLEEWLILKE
jgi:hypothetical protein